MTSTEVSIKFFERHLKEDVLKYGERQAIHMAIAALREQPQWISVEERLPKEAVRVLVCLDGDKPPIGEPRMDTDRVVDGRWVRWFDLVTHWMPLPEPQDISATTSSANITGARHAQRLRMLH